MLRVFLTVIYSLLKNNFINIIYNYFIYCQSVKAQTIYFSTSSDHLSISNFSFFMQPTKIFLICKKASIIRGKCYKLSNRNILALHIKQLLRSQRPLKLKLSKKHSIQNRVFFLTWGERWGYAFSESSYNGI